MHFKSLRQVYIKYQVTWRPLQQINNVEWDMTVNFCLYIYSFKQFLSENNSIK